MDKKGNIGEPKTYVLSEARCLELVQHMKSIETILSQSGYVPPWSGDECSPTFDIVVEEIGGTGLGAGSKTALLKFPARRGCVYSFHNKADQDATLKFTDRLGGGAEAAKKELDLEGEPPELKVPTGETRQLKIKTEQNGPQTLAVEINVGTTITGGAGGGPEMEIDDP